MMPHALNSISVALDQNSAGSSVRKAGQTMLGLGTVGGLKVITQQVRAAHVLLTSKQILRYAFARGVPTSRPVVNCPKGRRDESHLALGQQTRVFV